MPKTPPSSRRALFAPEAWPCSCQPTAESTTFATGAKNRPIPTPAMMNGARRLMYETVGVMIAASQPSATACSASPAAMNGRPP